MSGVDHELKHCYTRNEHFIFKYLLPSVFAPPWNLAVYTQNGKKYASVPLKLVINIIKSTPMT
jgi:hypothetical protein